MVFSHSVDASNRESFTVDLMATQFSRDLKRRVVPREHRDGYTGGDGERRCDPVHSAVRR
jgi:hypothetical protein